MLRESTWGDPVWLTGHQHIIANKLCLEKWYCSCTGSRANYDDHKPTKKWLPAYKKSDHPHITTCIWSVTIYIYIYVCVCVNIVSSSPHAKAVPAMLTVRAHSCCVNRKQPTSLPNRASSPVPAWLATTTTRRRKVGHLTTPPWRNHWWPCWRPTWHANWLTLTLQR